MKAYAHQVVLTILNYEGISPSDITTVIENTRYPNHCIAPKVVSIKTVEIPDWHDDHPLNKVDTADAEWHRLFRGGER